MTRLPNRLPDYTLNGITASDDGTTVTFSASDGTKLFSIIKATGQFQVAGGYDTDTTL